MLIDEDNVRTTSGFEEDEIDGSSILVKIEAAETEVKNDLHVTEYEDVLELDDNGLWKTSHSPIADKTLTGSVTTDDITVYLWGTEGDPSTKTEVTVNELYEQEGKLDLDVNSGYVTANYEYYNKKHPPDLDLLKRAISNLASYKAMKQVMGRIPMSRMGAISLNDPDPGEPEFLETYEDNMRKLKNGMASG